ncbi:hypothetical protein ABIA39_008505 [Nocardia sp. GAS34]|uniref:hypothetical protein n=1 Tax=unclassified Nocardia TaxID=2637762 RepID=UPI003D1F00AC
MNAPGPTGHKHYAGGPGWAQSSSPAVDSGARPSDPLYADLLPSDRQRWALAVAENVVWYSRQPHALHTIDDCWIDTDLAMCLCYSNTGGRFAARFTRLEVSPLFGPEHPPYSASEQASNLYSVQLGGGPPARSEWTDPDGRSWWGDAPARGWPHVLDPGTRLVTIPR